MAKKIELVSKVNDELMRILGVDPKDKLISKIVVTITPSSYPEIEVTNTHVTKQGLEKNIDLFELTPKGDK